MANVIEIGQAIEAIGSEVPTKATADNSHAAWVKMNEAGNLLRDAADAFDVRVRARIRQIIDQRPKDCLGRDGTGASIFRAAADALGVAEPKDSRGWPAFVVDGCTRLASHLAGATSRLSVHSAPDDLAPARWFTRSTDITSDQLRKAANVGQIHSTKAQGGQRLYSKSAAKAKWPHLWVKPNAKPKA